MYEIKELPTVQNVSAADLNLSAYVTRDEFNEALKAIKEVLSKTNSVTPKTKQPNQKTEQKSQISFDF